MSCTSCGKQISVPYWSIVAVLPWFAAFGVMLVIQDRALLGFWLGGISVLLGALIWASFVPLVKR